MKKRKLGRKLLSFLLTLAMLVGLMPGMGLTAYADNTCTVTFKANGRTVSKEVTLPHTFSCNYSSENGEFDLIIKELYQLDGGCCGLNPPTVSGSTNVTGGISGDNQYITVNAPFEGTATFDSVYFDSSKGYMDFEIHLEISCTGAVAAYSVTITPGSNMTKTSGEASQTGLSGPMTDVVYTANEGYYFPENYSVAEVNGISVTRDSYTQITVSGTPTADAAITLTAPTEKTTPAAPTTAAAVDCTTSDNNDGKLTGVTAAMEYKKSDAADWTAGTGSDITGLVPGTYYVRVKATDTTNASGNQELTINAAQTQTDTLLTTITATDKEKASYNPENVASVSFSYTAGGSSAYLANWGWWGYGWTATVNAAEGYTITKCVFYDDANRKATDSEAPFVVETTEEDKTPRINGTPIDGGTSQSKGLKKIEVYGYATPASSHSVTITPGDNMTKTAGSGDAEQTGLTGVMTDVVYTANDGYYFPEDYAVTAVNGISVTRDSYTQITVSGTPTADAAIALTAPTAKTTPDAPTTAAATDCTTADNNDGKLTGVTTAMEYKKSDAEDWTAGTGSDITGLVPGTYYVRVKATETTNASTNQELTIANYNTAAANTVSGTISALPAAADITLDNAQAVADAKAAYDALTDDQKALVPADTVNKLNAAVAKIADLTAANTVSSTISALPAAADITLDNAQAVADAKAAYDALTDDQKTLVPADTVNKLNAAVAKIADLTAANTVSSTISALPAAVDVTLDNAKAVADAKAAYDALTDDQKALVPADTVNKLNAAVAKIADLTAANTVSGTISALPAAADITLDNAQAVADAKAAYDALTDDQKALVPADTVNKLNAAVAKIADLTAANTVSGTISALPAAADITLDNAQAVADAKAAYDALTDDQKALVPADTVNKLNAAVAKIADLAAANTVSGTISALPDFSNVTTDNKAAIEAARAAYNALTADQKGLVSADTLKKLTDAEDKLVIIQVMSEVSAKTGSSVIYTGDPIQLINTPTTALPEGYTMKYAVTTENTAPTDDNLYTTDNYTATDAGTYYVWFKVVDEQDNIRGGVSSVEVTIIRPTEIVTQPAAAKVIRGSKAKFSVEATGDDLTYVWQISKDGVNWSNSTASGCDTDKITFRATKALNGKYYRCVITGAGGVVISDAVKLTTLAVINGQPGDAAATIGSDATFSVSSRSSAATYQWQVSTDGGETWKKSSAEGCDTEHLTVNVKSAKYGKYLFRCKVTNGTWVEYSKAAGIDIVTFIVKQPETIFASEGDKVKLYVKATGIAPTYQWEVMTGAGNWVNSTAPGNATNIITFKATAEKTAYKWRCKITDGDTVLYSNVVTLIIESGQYED